MPVFPFKKVILNSIKPSDGVAPKGKTIADFFYKDSFFNLFLFADSGGDPASEITIYFLEGLSFNTFPLALYSFSSFLDGNFGTFLFFS